MSTEAMRKALETIERWELPATGKFWDAEKTRPVSYAAEYGSNGEQEYMRAVARAALAAPQVQPEQAAQAQPIKHWCETCEGVGTIDERLGGYSFSNPAAECPDCHGKGWWVSSLAEQAQPQAGQDWRMRLAGIAAECRDPDTTDALDALLSETDAPSPAAPPLARGWKLVPVEPTPQMIDAAGLHDCVNSGSLRGAWRDMLAAAPSQADQPAAQEAGRVGLTDEQIDAVLDEAHRQAVTSKATNGGMVGELWNHIAARAIERAHGIPAAKAEGER